MLAGPSCFLSSGDGYVREILELHQGCQGPSRSSRGEVGFFLSPCMGKRPHLALRGESLVFLELQQETWGSSRFTTGTSGTRSCCLRKVQSPCELRRASRDSSPVLTWILWFPWRFKRGVRPHLMWRYASLLSSRAVTAVSVFQSC